MRISRSLKAVAALVAASTLTLSACTDDTATEAGTTADESAGASTPAASTPAQSSSAETSTTTAAAGPPADFTPTPGGTTLTVGESAQVVSENTEGETFYWEMTFTGVEDLPAAQVDEISGGPLEVADDPNFVVDTYQCVNFDVTYLGSDAPAGEYAAVGNPVYSVTPLTAAGNPANNLVTIGLSQVCNDGSRAALPDNAADLNAGTTYMVSDMSYTNAEGAGRATGAEFEYDVPSMPDLTGTIFTWNQ